MAIIDLATYKAHRGVSDTVTLRDAVWSQKISAAQSMAEQFCGRLFDSAARTEKHSGNGGAFFIVKNPPITAIASIAITAAVVFTQSLYGAGNTKFVMVVEGILHTLCLVPLAWILGVWMKGGLVGIWAAAGIYVVLLAIIMGAKFAEGRWRTIRL